MATRVFSSTLVIFLGICTAASNVIHAADSSTGNSEDCDVETSFFGLEFAMSGYNVLYGYPKNNGRDPGWKEEIFAADFTEDPPRFTSDCSYKLPKGVNVKRTVACTTSFKSSEVRTSKELEKSLEVNANVEGEGWGVSFSASAGYKESLSEIRNENSMYIFSEANCIFYTLNLIRVAPPPLSAHFKTAIRALEQNDQRDTFFNFFETYGTHFTSLIDYGARYTKQYKMTSSDYKRASERGVSVEVQAGYAGAFSVSGGFGLSSDQQEMAQEFRQDVEEQTSSIGAQPVASGDEEEWAANVENQTPAPVKYELLSIEELFTSSFFSAGDNIDYQLIKTRINKYKMEYCLSLVRRGIIDTCEAIEDPKCNVPVSIPSGSVQCSVAATNDIFQIENGETCTVTCNNGLSTNHPSVSCEVFGQMALLDYPAQCKSNAVGFMAYPSETINYNSGDKVAFDQTYTNIGSKYNRDTSSFTCPVTGLYAFHVSAMNGANSVCIKLMVGWSEAAAACSWTAYEAVSTASTVVCNKNDLVNVYMYSSGKVYKGAESTFSGYLIQEKLNSYPSLFVDNNVIGFLARPMQTLAYQSGTKVKFEWATTNEGNSYDGSSSDFKCPVSGLYAFFVSVMNSNGGFCVGLRLAGSTKAETCSWKAYEAVSTSMIVFCAKDSRVNVYVRNSGTIWGSFESTFSGYLIPTFEALLPYSDHKSIGFMAKPTKNRAYSTGNKILFDKEITNFGGGYSTSNSAFTCPLTGLYEFYTSAMNGEGGFCIALKVDNNQIAAACTWTRYEAVSTAATVQCSLGSSVSVYLSHSGTVWGSAESTFSGHFVSI